jgi:hypothetical protein
MACEVDAVGVVDDAIEDRIGIGRIANQIVPFVDWDLAGDDGRSAAVAFFEDLEEIVPCSGVERFEAPIVEDEQLHAAERPQDARIASVAAGERKIGEQFWNALIEDGAVVATSLVTERRGKPTLADAGRAHDILPTNSRLKLSFAIRIILALENALSPTGDSFTRGAFTL